jgi:hypothetical protein
MERKSENDRSGGLVTQEAYLSGLSQFFSDKV